MKIGILLTTWILACGPPPGQPVTDPVPFTPSVVVEDLTGQRAGAQVRFLSPTSGNTVPNPVTFEIDASGVDTLSLLAEDWELKRWKPTVEGWSQTYTFQGTDTPRIIRIRGLDRWGRVVATDVIDLVVSSTSSDVPGEPPDNSDSGPPGPAEALDVPYFYQYDNANEGWATCGITSAAMLIDYWYPHSVTPDTLYVAYGKAQGQSPGGLAQLYRWEGLTATHVTNGTREQIRRHLDAGRPVVAHGFWTGSGHIVNIIGYDETGWIVHDPAGDWEVCYGCGSGEAVRYAIGGGWDERLSYDGDIWFSTADRSGF